MASSPTVLVTGSAGHLGHALMISLPTQGYRPIGIDILSSSHTTHVGSIADSSFVASIFSRYPSLQHIPHTATLHKPHVDSHAKSEFVETNIRGTLILLELAVESGHIKSFVFTSTTSTFGAALAPKSGQPAAWIDESVVPIPKPAAWIDESVVPIPKNIYGATKCAAEFLCRLVHSQSKMSVLVLKTSRFFQEPDDSADAREMYDDDNLKVLELLHRRADIADVVSAHVCAIQQAEKVGWGKFIVSAPPPFVNDERTLQMLNGGQAGDLIRKFLPDEAEKLLAKGGEKAGMEAGVHFFEGAGVCGERRGVEK
ncbi:NAD-dependent epimerase like protein [Zymoseptoria brevis]|uniref:NAD-dependent epimerase like protein n=1 Tax=Zymoseptoria brevis TaxID=1047168 RepID=A0A0F4GLY5_9PEZI|nr:NAD-dependent epimerase like protein [Zymoseptoria brevis]